MRRQGIPDMDSAVLEPGLPSELAAETDAGALGIFHLKRYWSRHMLARQGKPVTASKRERRLDYLVVNAVGLGIEQTSQYLGRHAPSFEAFERWIVETTGGVAPERIARINAAITGGEYPEHVKQLLAAIEADERVLSADDLALWHEHGYVVLHDAVPAQNLGAAAQA